MKKKTLLPSDFLIGYIALPWHYINVIIDMCIYYFLPQNLFISFVANIFDRVDGRTIICQRFKV